MDVDQKATGSRVERRRRRMPPPRRAAKATAVPRGSAPRGRTAPVALAITGIVAMAAAGAGAWLGETALAVAGATLGGLAGLAAAVVLAKRTSDARQLVARERELRARLDTVATLLTTARQAPDQVVSTTESDTEDELEGPAFDPISGLMHQQHLAVVIQQRVAAARRRIQPVSVVVFEISGLDRAARNGIEPWQVVGRVVRSTLRESDVACRIGDATLVAVLEDTPEQGGLTTAERFRQALRRCEIGPHVTVSSGIAGYPSHALDAPDLLMRAGQALDVARNTGVDFLAAPVD